MTIEPLLISATRQQATRRVSIGAVEVGGDTVPVIAGPVRGRGGVRRARGRGASRRRLGAARVCPQATHATRIVPGVGARGIAIARRGETGHRIARDRRTPRRGRHSGAARPRRRAAHRRTLHAQHAAAPRRGPERYDGDPETRHVGHVRRMARRRRLHHHRRQWAGHPLRARHSNVRNRHAEHPRRECHRGASRYDRPSDRGRSESRCGPCTLGPLACSGGARRRRGCAARRVPPGSGIVAV